MKTDDRFKKFINNKLFKESFYRNNATFFPVVIDNSRVLLDDDLYYSLIWCPPKANIERLFFFLCGVEKVCLYHRYHGVCSLMSYARGPPSKRYCNRLIIIVMTIMRKRENGSERLNYVNSTVLRL